MNKWFLKHVSERVSICARVRICVCENVTMCACVYVSVYVSDDGTWLYNNMN